MKTIRRFCAVAVSVVIIASMLAAMPASADTPEAFKGSASAWALNAKVLNLVDLKAGYTNVSGDSSPLAHADGAGLSGLPILTQSVSSADAAVAGKNVTPPQACVAKLPIQGVLDLSLACSTSAASTMPGGPMASSTSSVVGLDVGILNVVLQLLKPVTDILAPLVDKTIGSVTGTLQPVLGGLLTSLNLGSLGLDLNKPVSSLLTALQKLTTLAQVTVLPSVSTVTSSAGVITANAVAKGAEILVLPGLTLLGHPLLTIKVLAAEATATYNRALGTSSASVDPAVVSVQLLDGAPVKVGLDTFVVLDGTPLKSTISLGAGATKKALDGSVTAVADGLSIHLLTGISGGINLDLAHAQAAVTGAMATVSPPTTPAPTTTTTTVVPIHTGRLLLATTGSSLPLLPIGFMLVLVGYLIRRRLAKR